MGPTRNADRVATLIAAVSLGVAITGPAVAIADPGWHQTPKHSESSSGSESRSPSDDSTEKTNSSGDKHTASPGRTPISATRSFPGHTNTPFENASPNSRFRPPANVDGDGLGTQPPGKFVFGRHDCGETTPEPPKEPEPPEIPPESSPETSTPPEDPEVAVAPVLPEPVGSDFAAPQPEFKQPTVTFSMPAEHPESVAPPPPQPAAAPSEPLAEAPQIIAVEAPVIRAPIETSAPPPVQIAASPVATLTSRVGTGAMALTAILVVLMTGVWFYGNRLASHLTRRNDHG